MSINKFSTKFTPGNNFFMYVNENWINSNPIPAEFSRWGTFSVLQETNDKRVKKIVETTYPENSKFNKFSILYNQGLESKAREKKRIINDVYVYINEIQSKQSIDDLLKLVVDYQITCNIESPFYFKIHNDFDNANINILHLDTDGLGLPDRDYYFLESKKKEQDEYKKFLKKINNYFYLNLNIKEIYKLEEKLAKYTYTRVQNRSPELLKNTRTLEQIITDYPSFQFIKYFFKKINVTPKKINLINPKFFANLNKLYRDIDLQIWKDYYIYKFLITMKDYLSINLEKICFNFYEKVLNGTQKIKPLEQRVLLNTENQLGQLIGQCFVKKYFSSNAKKVVGEMCKYLKNEFRNSIQNLEWMEDITKIKALNKLDNMKIKIAHPTKWRVYTTDIRKEYSYFKNNIMCNIANNEYRFNKLYKAINRNEWFMNPQKVNAYYSPTYNEIVFPAGILQPPFFSENYDKAINFGGIGSVICHEITHGFDDKGCKYDAYGNLKNWWHKSDFKKYKSKTLILKNQFDNYIIEGMKVNGELTLGENLADFGGLTIALRGLKKYLNDTDNYNLKSIQNFFISYARVWCSNSRKKDIIQRLLVDVHSPPLLRVNGIVKNIPEFYEAFNIKETDELYLEPKKRAKIW